MWAELKWTQKGVTKKYSENDIMWTIQFSTKNKTIVRKSFIKTLIFFFKGYSCHNKSTNVFKSGQFVQDSLNKKKFPAH